MKHSRIAVAALTLALGATPFLTAQYSAPDQGRGWDAPPQEFREVQRRGFHDGIEAARKDINLRRPANAEMHEEFRHPEVEEGLREDYREGFRRGYNVAFAHSQEVLGGQPMAQPGPPPEQNRGQWDAPPSEFREMQRKGFHDGIEAARRDIAEQRPQDVEQKREFREPPVAPEVREEYREGFRRGYDMAFHHLREDQDHH